VDNLVFLEPDCLNEIPFTTSEVIAENGDVNHATVKRLIRKYKSDLEEFGILGFKIREIEGRGQPEKIYKLNEQQATLLITYMQNTLPVRKFKKALVKQFYIMQKELNKRTATRMKAKQAREALTNAIQGLPDSPHKSMKYKHYTDLVYKIVFNKNSKQLREDYGITAKDSLRDYFTADQITEIERLENQIGVLIDLGNDYKSIKMALGKKYLIAS
jgi:phage regulator Rha-like protein